MLEELAALHEIIGRSRKGAWIEMLMLIIALSWITVAPVRERGLK